MSSFKIKIKPGTPAVFDPNPLQAEPNDSVFWFNGDNIAHWPAPAPKKPTDPINKKAWLDYQIPPNASSTQIALNPAKFPYCLNYVCALHPKEKGQIKVGNTEKKGAFGCKTKKGAFGGKTKKGAFGGKIKIGAVDNKIKIGAVDNKIKKGAFGRRTR